VIDRESETIPFTDTAEMRMNSWLCPKTCDSRCGLFTNHPESPDFVSVRAIIAAKSRIVVAGLPQSRPI
jgi:hypothetical protein